MTLIYNEFELYVERELHSQLSKERATETFAAYVEARPKVHQEIERIAKTEPDLTDHGPRHIDDVMKRVLALISIDSRDHGLACHDLYILIMATLFHDVGNLFGRKKHNEQIGQVFDFARGKSAAVRREKSLVLLAARAHTGLSSSGDENTLIELDENAHFHDGSVQLRSIAAILRLADELAEGPHRTTEFYRKKVGYSDTSGIFHEYANCTSTLADRKNKRICLSYDIDLDDYVHVNRELDKQKLISLLDYIKLRITKLDQERRYTRYYCNVIEPFNRTEVTIGFSFDGNVLPNPISFSLDDLVIPGHSGHGTEVLVEKRFGQSRLVADYLDTTINSAKGPNVV